MLMKKCQKCGAIQSDDRTLCVDCGGLLGKPMSAQEQAKAEETLSETVSGMAQRTEDFCVTTRARVLGIVSIAAAAALVFLFFHIMHTLDLLQSEIPDGVVLMEGGGAVTVIGSGENGDMEQARLSLMMQESLQATLWWSILGLFCFILTALYLLVPKAMWYLSTVRYRLWFGEVPPPSGFALAVGKIITYACFAVGAFSLVTVLWRML